MAHGLIVVDVQNDFCPGGLLAISGGDEIVAPINAIMDSFDAVILTQDWHPDSHTSFADNHTDAAAFTMIEMAYGPQVLWPKHCVMGSAGAEFHPELDRDRADLVLRKGYRPSIDSYSAFFENDHRTATGLAGYLRDRGIGKLSFVGLALDYCVAWSAIDAARLGFDAIVLEHACRAINRDGSLDQARAEMRRAGVSVEQS